MHKENHNVEAAHASIRDQEILLADASVEQLDVLLTGLRAGVIVKLVTGNDDSIQMFADALMHPRLDTLHVLGHGAPGEVILGAHNINMSTLPRLKQHLDSGSFTVSEHANATGSSILADNTRAQICLWSCQTGGEHSGEAFINALAQMTRTDVFASAGFVGNTAKGGTWSLEKSAHPRRDAPFANLSDASGVGGK